MSMVGYILGLGDRHPSNIMLERHSGKIVHIDFGDCFEIAMRREKFPEKIPFRLTRMLTKAMEVSSIEVNYRSTCENTMKVMRENKESLLAIMEAFVYDPLISFRLLNPKMFKKLLLLLLIINITLFASIISSFVFCEKFISWFSKSTSSFLLNES